MTTTATKIPPIDRVLELLPDAKGPNASDWYQAHCPAHTDQERSLSFKAMADQHSEGVAFHCFAHCQREAIINALGLTEEDLRLDLDPRHKRTLNQTKPITLLDLAIAKGIHWKFLMSELGLIDGEETYHRKDGKPFKKKGVIIPYYTADGKPYQRRRLRTALAAKDGSLWSEDDRAAPAPPIPYGLERLALARQAGYLVIVEGESDCWTLWRHQLPALGLPGATLYEKIAPAHLGKIDRVYIVQEPDAAGREFPNNVYRHLANIGYAGQVYALNLARYSAKDPNDLYKKNQTTFKRLFEQALSEAQLLFTPPLPEVIIAGQLREYVADALKALQFAEKQAPTLFVQSGRLVQIGRDEQKRPIIINVGIAELRNALTRSADFYRIKAIGKGEDQDNVLVAIPPPKDLAEAILALNPAQWGFPPLEAVVEMPVMRPDFTILDQPGYDAATRLYYIPQEGLSICQVPDRPTQADKERALALIKEAIGEFPYADAADKANAYAAYITPFIRPAIKQHIPMTLYDAPKQGTGKTLAVDAVAVTATGKPAVKLTSPDDDDEWDKRIIATLIQGKAIVCIDNVAGDLKSAKLDAMLTSDEYGGRILGMSRMIQVPNRAVWFATGNNIKLGGDLPRRCYRIRLDPHISRPWMRTGFKHEDLLSWISEHRGELIAAVLTLARSWYIAGKPQAQDIPALGTFTNWARTIGGILEHCGVSGFLSNLENLYDEVDEDSAQWEAFFTAWRQIYGGAWRTTAEFIGLLGTADSAADSAKNLLLESLPESLQMTYRDNPKTFAIIFGKALRRQVDTCYGKDNLRLQRDKDTHTKGKKWRVVADSADSSIIHAQGEITTLFEEDTTDKNHNNIRLLDYPHYPHAENGYGDSTGSTSGSTDESQHWNGAGLLSANGVLSAEGPMEEGII